MFEVDLTKSAHAGSRLFTPSWKPAVVIVLLVLALKPLGGVEKALPELSCIAALALTLVTKWRLRRSYWFWIVMSVFATAHVAAVVFAVRWENLVSLKGFCLLAVLDWLAMIWILALIAKIMGERLVVQRPVHAAKRSRNPN